MGKGVSTLMGAIILIGIAVAAGASVFNIANQYAAVGFSKTEYSVLDASLSKSGSDCVLQVELINTGTTQIVKTVLRMSTDKTDALPTTPPPTILIPENPPLPIIEDGNLPNQFSPIIKITDALRSVDPGKKIPFVIFFSPCAWNLCQEYTFDVLSEATGSSTSSTSHILACKESSRV